MLKIVVERGIKYSWIKDNSKFIIEWENGNYRVTYRAMSRCIQDLNMKGIILNIYREPHTIKKMKSSNVEDQIHPSRMVLLVLPSL